MLINAELLLQYQRCKRRPYLDIHGDFSQKDAINDLLLKLQQDKHAHQESVLAQWDYYQPDYRQRNWQQRMAATIELMQQGVECIYQGLLLANYSDIRLRLSELADTAIEDAQNLSETLPSSPSPSPLSPLPLIPPSPPSNEYTLLSRPDLLIKQPGKSCFGNWMYVPANIELGKRPKQEYQVVAAFHAQILATVQQAESEIAWLMLRGKEVRYPVDLRKWTPQMHRILEEFLQTLEIEEAPEMFISRQRCSLCHWYSNCYAKARSQKHLSLLPGITPVRYTQLQALNITKLESLAQTNPTTLENLPGFDSEIACKLVLQAQSVVENRPLVLSYQSQTPTENGISGLVRDGSIAGEAIAQSKSYLQEQSQVLTKAATSLSIDQALIDNITSIAPIELYFDIEAQPDLNLNYLLGVLVVDRQTNTENFYSLLAEKPEDEKLIWQQFLDLVWQYPDAPIYHFCVYEFDTVKRLAKLYRTPHTAVEPILSRFVDVYENLIQSVALPVESYALKAIARWLGFEWRDAEASGAKCIYWYDQWLRTGDRSLLEVIQRYNEDDCRATRNVKDWLVNFFQTK